MDFKLPCRCCLQRPPDTDFFAQYQTEVYGCVYADMLKNCFSIQLNSSHDKISNGICKPCAVRLQDACDFKAQVQKCQDYLDKLKQAEDVVKEEPANDHWKEDDPMMSKLFGLNLKGLTIKWKRKKEDNKQDVPIKKIKLNKNEDSRIKDVPINNILKLKKKDCREYLPIPIPKNKNMVKLGKYKTKANIHAENIQNIINNSNATLFYTQDMYGIKCLYCKQTIPNIQQLRTHIKSDHKSFMLSKVIPERDRTVKMDITDLKCNVCNKNLDTVDSLKRHLTDKHIINFDSSVETTVMEFKLSENKSYDCAICEATHERFKMLLQHMHTHYRNYICNICNAGFVAKRPLRTHIRTHELGRYLCSFCEKIFPTKVRLVNHEKFVHRGKSRDVKCSHCDKTFASYSKRDVHLKEIHNLSDATYKCKSCDRTYTSKRNLTNHIKKAHLMERNVICSYCGKEYFDKSGLSKHIIKHERKKTYKCKICLKSYSRIYTLKEHMRIHNDDRRFKCGVCGLAFVQKCSMKSHMVSNHGVTQAEYERENDVNMIK